MKKLRPGVRLRNKGTPSPYSKYSKRPYNYAAMYRRLQETEPELALCKHRRRLGI